MEFHTYAVLAVPGLLQTEEYARTMFTVWRPRRHVYSPAVRMEGDAVHLAVTAAWERPSPAGPGEQPGAPSRGMGGCGRVPEHSHSLVIPQQRATP